MGGGRSEDDQYPPGPVWFRSHAEHLILSSELLLFTGCVPVCVWVGGGCGATHSDGGGEDSVHGGSVGSVQGDVDLLEQSEEERPLVSCLMT